MDGEILAMWSRSLEGIDLDVDLFVTRLLGTLLRAPEIVGRAHDGNEAVIGGASEVVRFDAPGAKAKLRMVCARLAVVFGNESRDPPSPYGGHAVAQLRIGDALIEAELDFKNTPDGVWFRVKRSR